jgi:hypothetical protein
MREYAGLMFLACSVGFQVGMASNKGWGGAAASFCILLILLRAKP